MATRISSTRPLIRNVRGKKLYCLPDQSAPDLDMAAVEKRRCNALVAKHCRFECGLDAFAGVGVGARYWSACAKHLYLVENRPAALKLLQQNLPAIGRKGCTLHPVVGTAHKFLERAVSDGRRFDLVDCDPFGSCYELLPLLVRVVPRGVICLTTGEILQVYRGLNRRPGRPPAREFRGHRASEWVVTQLLPELVRACGDAQVVHFYAYPTSVRVILTLGGFPLPEAIFSGRPNFLGWLAERGSGQVARAQLQGTFRKVD